jgi:hypothetical protein
MARNARMKSGFNFGGEAAEVDGFLEDAFIQSGDYLTIESRTDHRCLLVGRTGAGKSAALKRLEDTHSEHTIRINPENLSLPYITNLQVIRHLDSLEINLDNFWQTLWRHVLIVEVLRHRYKVDSPSAKNRFLIHLREKLQNDRTKKAALAYLDEYEGRFWCESDERVREITDKFTERFDAEASGKLGGSQIGLGGSIGAAAEISQESRTEQVARFQRIVNDSQLARLNKMIDVLDDDVLDSPHHFTYIVIDDLDKEWVDERIANDLIRCLFSTVYSLHNVRNLKIVVALRTNIFQELDFGRRGGGQEEKFRALIQEVKWTRAALVEMLDERANVAGKRAGFDANVFSEFLPGSNATMGKPVDYILDRTLLRPRDALAFANECFKVGSGKDRLTWTDIKTAERTYSIGRVLALRDEWKGTFPGIGDAVEKFRHAPMRMNREEFQKCLDDAILLMGSDRFDGLAWMTRATAHFWAASPDMTWSETYQPLIGIFYRIGLIGVAPRGVSNPIFIADDPHFVDQTSNLEVAEHFFLHRTYHKGLEIKSSGERRGGM